MAKRELNGRPSRTSKGAQRKRAESAPNHRAWRAPEIDFDDLLYGIHAVDEALAAREALHSVHVAEDRVRDPRVREVSARAKELDVPVRIESRTWFARLPYKAHQGVAAIGAPFAYASLHDVLRPRTDGRPHLFVLLDHVTDPHNLGAIVRTAECAGADAVIIPERRAAGVNATVRKAAAGATEHLPVVRVANVAETVRALKKAHVWVAGALGERDATPMASADLASDLCLVVGAEGTGLAPLVRRECDYLVAIPLFGRVGSLNASVAAGILLYEALRQRGASRESP